MLTQVKNKSGNTYNVTGDLTVKQETNPVHFIMDIRENSAEALLTIDRTKYNVRYGSGSFFDNLGDNTIYDNFDLDVKLKF